MAGLFNWRVLGSRRLVVFLVILLVASSYFSAAQYGRLPTGDILDVVPRPLLNYTSMGFENVSVVRDLWNESFEVPLNSTNHYWYGNGTEVTIGSVYRNNTLDPGFEEIASSDLNPYVNLPSWFLHQQNPNITVRARRDNITFDSQTWENLTSSRNGGFENNLMFWDTFENGTWKTASKIENDTVQFTEGSHSLYIKAIPKAAESNDPFSVQMGVNQSYYSFAYQAFTDTPIYMLTDFLVRGISNENYSGASYFSVSVVLENSSLTPVEVTIDYDYFVYAKSGNPAEYVSNSSSNVHFIIEDAAQVGTWYVLARNVTSDYETSSVFNGVRRVSEIRLVTVSKAYYDIPMEKWYIGSTGGDPTPSLISNWDRVYLKPHSKIGHSAYLETNFTSTLQENGHIAGGLQIPQDYFVKIPCVYLTDTPQLSAAIYLNNSGTGGGNCTAYYTVFEVEISVDDVLKYIVYVAPIMTSGSPSSTHFSNSTNKKYIYGATAITEGLWWFSFTRNIRIDYENLWGQVSNATITKVSIKNDLYQPQAGSENQTPFIRANFDVITLKLLTFANQEQIVNNNFEAKGWVKTQEDGFSQFSYSKDSSESNQSTTSFKLDVVGNNTNGQAAVGIDASNFIRESYDTSSLQSKGYIKIVSMSNVNQTQRAFLAVRIKVEDISVPPEDHWIWYCVMLHGSTPTNDPDNKYYELVDSSSVQTGVWYEFSRNPAADGNFGGGAQWRIVEIALVVVYESASQNPSIEARFDYIRLIEELPAITEYVGQAERSQNYVLDGNYSLRQYARLGEGGWAKYECGAENANNTFYVAFPSSMNLSLYYYVASAQFPAAVQISLAIDDGPNYGSGYLYELIYYYGNSSGVGTLFTSSSHAIQVSSSIPTIEWTRLNRNWTVDLPGSWTLQNPRIEAVGLKVWTAQNTVFDVYYDVTAFFGEWHGAKKTIQLQLKSEILTKQFNVSDLWVIKGNQDLVPPRANSTSSGQWYYKWWDENKICVINASDTYEISGNYTSQGIFSYYDNDWNPEDDAVLNDWSGYVKYNVTDFKLTAYGENLEYLDYLLVEYLIIFCGPSGIFKFDNDSTATAANDPDEYGGLEYWLLDKQGNIYRNYITSNSTFTVSY